MKSKIIIIFKKYPNLINFIQYGMVGVVGTIIHTVMLTICVEIIGIIPLYSTVIGFLFSLIVSYILNSIWTFKANSTGRRQFFKYLLTCLFGLLINMFIMYIIVDVINYSYLVAQLLAVMTVPIFNFTISKYWVFTSMKSSSNNSV